MTDELDRAARALLDDLREDYGDVDAAALARVRRRLSPSVSPEVLEPSPLRAKSRGARVGLALALLVGTALGAGGHAFVTYVVEGEAHVEAPRRDAPRVEPTAARRSAHDEAAPRPPLPTVQSAAPAVPATNPQPALPRTPALASAASELEMELKDLEEARLAMAAGQAPRALAALRRHAQHFPHGALEQERDAMMVKALVATGSYGEARRAADHFRTAYPGSLLADSVERAAATIP